MFDDGDIELEKMFDDVLGLQQKIVKRSSISDEDVKIEKYIRGQAI